MNRAAVFPFGSTSLYFFFFLVRKLLNVNCLLSVTKYFCVLCFPRCFSLEEIQSWACDNLLSSRQRQHNDVIELL